MLYPAELTGQAPQRSGRRWRSSARRAPQLAQEHRRVEEGIGDRRNARPQSARSVWPWAGYFLDRIAQAYERFADRVAAGTSAGTKQNRIRDYVLLHAPAQFTIADIRRAVPGVSDNTIRLVLTELKAAGNVTVDGTGRGTTWSRT